MRIRILILIYFLSIPCVAFAQPTVTLRSDPFNEVLREAALISGVVVAGVLRHGVSVEGQEEVQLSADLPKRWAGNSVCVRVVSADGLYESSNAYDLPADWIGGVALLPFPTAYDDLLIGLAPKGLAIQIAQGDCTAALSDTTVALWNTIPDGEAPSLLINSFRADEVFAYVGDRPEAIRCDKVEAGGTSAFDHSCTLPDDLSGDVEVTIYRVSNGKPANPAMTQLWLGSGK